MAQILTDDNFVNACNHLIAQGQLAVQGARFIDRAARKVWDEQVNGNVDITPDTPTLEAALDSATVQLTTAQTEAAQANTAKATLQNLMSGLHALSAQDKGYAVYGRIFAARNGANQATVDGITNKATAQAYITGLAEWQNMTAASRAFFAKELEANAGLCMVLMLVLT